MAITRSFSALNLLRAALLVPLAGLTMNAAWAAEAAVTIPAPAADAAAPAGAGLQTIVLAGGCFWGVQAVFQHTKGVTAAVSGYAGGDKQNANYEMVGSGRTGHAESVAVTFDPQQISYGKILQIYFSVAHNPTELNRQGPDVGTQYRSAIFYADEEQKRIADSYVAQLEKAHVYGRPIVTRLEKLSGFYPAEDYHQDFAVLHPTYPYIVFNDAPKVENLKRLFASSYRDMPVTVMASTKAGH
jgi:peptide-methionine (S)-S-oxide reductase